MNLRKFKSGDCSSDESDTKMAQLVIKLEIKSKFKGNLLLIYFNYGKIIHFTAKCPYKEHINDEEEPIQRVFRGKY